MWSDCLLDVGTDFNIFLESIMTDAVYLKLVTVSGFCPFILISVLMPLALFVISLVFSTRISMP